MYTTLVVVAVFGVGVLAAVVSALNWHTRRIWHLLPPAYGAAADLLFRFVVGVEISLYSAAVFAVMSYGIAWLMYLQEFNVAKRKQGINNKKREVEGSIMARKLGPGLTSDIH
ncbi:MAG: hypothetical protein KGL73_14130 [Burkholderiales bacterium]|nr:hypothetical protein [Burkholderiales bacterium]